MSVSLSVVFAALAGLIMGTLFYLRFSGKWKWFYHEHITYEYPENKPEIDCIVHMPVDKRGPTPTAKTIVHYKNGDIKTMETKAKINCMYEQTFVN